MFGFPDGGIGIGIGMLIVETVVRIRREYAGGKAIRAPEGVFNYERKVQAPTRSPTIPARCLPTAPIAALISAVRFAPGAERRASLPLTCGAAMNARRSLASMPGTSPHREDLRHL